MYEDDFRTRLGRTVLEAYAHGVAVVGQHDLAHEDPHIPDVQVLITAEDRTPNGRGSSAAETATAGREAFETALQDLVLTAFADECMADPSGRWSLRFPAEMVPDWSVEVVLRFGVEHEGTDDPDRGRRSTDRSDVR